MEILELSGEHAPEVTDVLVEAFYDYPVMRFVLADVPEYSGAIRRLVGLFVAARGLRGEPMVGIPGDAGMERVHEMSRQDERSVGVTLTTESPSNVPLYQYLGYEVIGHARVAPELSTWGFFRPDEGAWRARVSSLRGRSRP